MNSMDDDKEITLTIAQLFKVMNLRPAQRIRFWIGIIKNQPVTEILDKIDATEIVSPK